MFVKQDFKKTKKTHSSTFSTVLTTYMAPSLLQGNLAVVWMRLWEAEKKQPKTKF